MGAGIAEDTVCLDPGIGFGKTVEHNVELVRRLDELVAIGRPIVVGFSRKSSLGRILGDPEGEGRVGGCLGRRGGRCVRSRRHDPARPRRPRPRGRAAAWQGGRAAKMLDKILKIGAPRARAPRLPRRPAGGEAVRPDLLVRRRARGRRVGQPATASRTPSTIARSRLSVRERSTTPSRFDLLEALAATVAETLREVAPVVARVKVRVREPAPGGHRGRRVQRRHRESYCEGVRPLPAAPRKRLCGAA